MTIRSEIRFVRHGEKISLRLGKNGSRIFSLLADGEVELTFEDPQEAAKMGEALALEGQAALKHRAETKGLS